MPRKLPHSGPKKLRPEKPEKWAEKDPPAEE
jgi:hypothetical protein